MSLMPILLGIVVFAGIIWFGLWLASSPFRSEEEKAMRSERIKNMLEALHH
jgi:FtsZ-interacting cell division protein ZipA